MPDFQMPDIDAISSALEKAKMTFHQSDKGRFFNHTWWPAHYHEVEGPVLRAIADENVPSFDRRVDILQIAEGVDAQNGKQLAELGFTPTEITQYVTRAVNKRLKEVTGDGATRLVIRNQKLTRIALEHKPA